MRRKALPSPRFLVPVLSGSYDGGLRAYAADDGSLLWQFDTNRTFGDREQGHREWRQHGRSWADCCRSGLLFVDFGSTAASPGRPGNVLLDVWRSSELRVRPGRRA